MYRIRFQISQRDTRPKPRSVYCWEILYTVGKIEEGGIFGGVFVEFRCWFLFVVIMLCIESAFKFHKKKTHGQNRGVYTVGRYCILLERSRKAGFLVDFLLNFVVVFVCDNVVYRIHFQISQKEETHGQNRGVYTVGR
jgi:hypothetical protein